MSTLIKQNRKVGVLILGMLLVAAALRAPMTSIPPLLEQIREHFQLDTLALGMVTTLPLLALAAIAPLSGIVSARVGLERAIMASMVLIAAGTLLRSAGPVWALYVGTLVVGGGIAVGNTLLPSLLKRDFPHRIPAMTASYVLAMGLASGIASAMAVPLSHVSEAGWALSAAAMALWPLIAAAAWMPQWLSRQPIAPSPVEGGSTAAKAAQPVGAARAQGRLWTSPLAWQITGFLGLNSMLFYIMMSWMPSMLAEIGYSQQAAGSLHGLLQLASALPGVLMIPLVRRPQHHRLLASVLSLVFGVGLVGIAVMPAWAVVWTVVYGVAAGATLILGLSFVGLRASSPQQAARLAGMSQSLGYLLAAAGPLLAAWLHERTHTWSTVLTWSFGLALIMAYMGWKSGKLVQLRPEL